MHNSFSYYKPLKEGKIEKVKQTLRRYYSTESVVNDFTTGGRNSSLWYLCFNKVTLSNNLTSSFKINKLG